MVAFKRLCPYFSQAHFSQESTLVNFLPGTEELTKVGARLYGYKQKAEMVAMHAIFERKELLMPEYVQGHNRKPICSSDREDFYQ